MLIAVIAVAVGIIGWALPVSYKPQIVFAQLSSNCVITSPNGDSTITATNIGAVITPTNGHIHVSVTLNINNNVSAANDVFLIERSAVSTVPACNTVPSLVSPKKLGTVKDQSVITGLGLIFEPGVSFSGQDNTAVKGTTYAYFVEVQTDFDLSGPIDKPTFLGSAVNPLCVITVMDL